MTTENNLPGMTTVRIRCAEDFCVVTIVAQSTRVPGLVIIPVIGYGPLGLVYTGAWAVAHQATGLLLPARAGEPAELYGLIADLAQVCDWTAAEIDREATRDGVVAAIDNFYGRQRVRSTN